jgi:hypothetical protein
MKHMMKGTDGNFDYVAICEADCLRVGIKPLIEVKGGEKDPLTGVSVLTFLAGIRIRAERKDQSTIVDVGKCVDQILEKVTWAKKSPERASTVIACDSVTSEGWITEEDFIEGFCNHDHVMQMWLDVATTLQDDHTPLSELQIIEEFFRKHIIKGVRSLLGKAHEKGIRFEPKGSLDNVIALNFKS